jgi:hypothetical protein
MLERGALCIALSMPGRLEDEACRSGSHASMAERTIRGCIVVVMMRQEATREEEVAEREAARG